MSEQNSVSGSGSGLESNPITGMFKKLDAAVEGELKSKTTIAVQAALDAVKKEVPVVDALLGGKEIEFQIGPVVLPFGSAGRLVLTLEPVKIRVKVNE